MPGCYLCVNLTTKRTPGNSLCEFQREEHPLFSSEISEPKFGAARDLPVALIEREMKNAAFPDFDGPLLERLYTAALHPHSALSKPFQRVLRAYLEKK